MAPALFSPITVRNLEVPNRLWVPPMCQYSCPDFDGMGNDWHLVHQGSMANGGAGLIFTEATAIVPEGRISGLDLGIWSDDHIAPLKRITDYLHSQGTLAGIQLAHAGRKASGPWPWREKRGSVPNDEGGWDTYGVTDQPFGHMKTPQESSVEYIEHIVHEFAESARRAVEAGYDMVEIHAAHGYLLHSFLSPYTNTRTDKYGGDTRKRTQFLVEVLESVRKVVGDMPISVRFSGTDYIEGGMDAQELVEIAKIAVEHGTDFFDISTGGLEPGVKMELYPGYQVDYARAVKEATGVPTSAVGLITTPDHADSLIRNGDADVVMVGREFLRNPHFGLHAAAQLGHGTEFTPIQYHRAPISGPMWINHISNA